MSFKAFPLSFNLDDSWTAANYFKYSKSLYPSGSRSSLTLNEVCMRSNWENRFSLSSYQTPFPFPYVLELELLIFE